MLSYLSRLINRPSPSNIPGGIVERRTGRSIPFVLAGAVACLIVAFLALSVQAQPVITSVIPDSASVGMPIIIEGEGFSEVPTLNTVSFTGGVDGLVLYPASDSVLVVVVPAGAVTGTVTVTVNASMTSTAFAVNAPLLSTETDENVINLQTVEGTYAADKAIHGDLLPHVQIGLDPDFVGINTPTVDVYLVPTDAEMAEPVISYSLTGSPFLDDQDIAVDAGSNIVFVNAKAGSRRVSYAAAMMTYDSTTVLLTMPLDPALTGTDGSETFHEHTLLVEVGVLGTDRTISESLQAEDLRPVGMVQDTSLVDSTKVLFTDTRERQLGSGETAADIQNVINLSPPSGIQGATVNVYRTPDIGISEAMPARLRNGGPNGTAAPNNNAYNANNGGFDNDGSTVAGGNPVGAAGTPSDEMNFFWQHFFMQTFAGHRLRDVIIAAAGGGAAAASGLAIEDFGFGDNMAANPALTDLPVARMGVGADPAVPPGSFDGFDFSAGGGAVPRAITNLNDQAGAPVGHGTFVAVTAAGSGAGFHLGPGKDANVFIYKNAGPITADITAIGHAAARADIDVMNFSAGVPHGPTAATFACRTASFRAAVRGFDTAGKIFVKSAGNAFGTAGVTAPAIPTNSAPARGGRAAAGALARMVVVAATDIQNGTRGQETKPAFSNTGTRVHVSAPGGTSEIVTRINGSIAPSPGGTSFAAPKVAGLLAEMIQVDETLNGVPGNAAALRTRRLRMVETCEGTADDLGTSGGASSPNNNAGNSADNLYGHGRINVWKAILSVVNGGLSVQNGRPTSGQDATFTSLPVVNDAGTTWYGFEMITSEKNATVWLDGKQLSDAGGTVPTGANIQAFKGVRDDLRIERGVHTASDGSSADGGNVIVEEDPTSGIAAIGTRDPNGEGLWVIHFSVRRDSLFELNAGNPDYNKPKTLSLRKPGDDENDKPFFNLRLDLVEMKTGRVTGVTFDDFVYQIAVPDYGDAKFEPTKLSARGARHHSSALEWLGKLSAKNLKSVTAEHNADVEAQGGDAKVDVDGVTNRIEFHDRDGRDDGLLFFPLSYVPQTTAGKVQFTIGVEDHESLRYAADADHSLFFNLWIDWNGDGKWDENNVDPANKEHVIDGFQVDPRNGPWNIVSQGLSGSSAAAFTSAPDDNSRTFEATIPVGKVQLNGGQIWARARLDYGENCGQNDPRPQFRSLPSMRSPGTAQGVAEPPGGVIGYTYGGARYGEVEDYLIGTDFGDAADIFCSIGLPPPPFLYDTCKGDNGPRHLDINVEWLGTDLTTGPNATREIDADDKRPPGTDEDGQANLQSEQTDKKDNGVTIPAIIPGTIRIFRMTPTASIQAYGGSGQGPGVAPNETVSRPEDAADDLPRYGAVSERKIYLSGWADWNGNSVFEASEKIIDDIQDPLNWGKNSAYTLGEVFEDDNKNGVHDDAEDYTDAFGVETKTFSYPVFIPFVVADRFSLRFRVAYGEDETTVNLEVKKADEDARNNNEDHGGALFGEVEDYVRSLLPPIWWPYMPPESPPYVPPFDTVKDTFLIGEFTFDNAGLPDPQGWTSVYNSPAGDFAQLYPGATVLQRDNCQTNLTNLWGFFDDPVSTNYACGGFPSQGAVTYLSIDNEIWSPKMPITGTGSEFRLVYRCYSDLPIENLILYGWKVRCTVEGVDQPWRDTGLCCYYRRPRWDRFVTDISAFIEPGATHVQVALTTADLCPVWCGNYGTGACHSNGPLFDDVQVVRVDGEGPRFVVRHLDLFQDLFPPDGSLTGRAPADAAVDIEPLSSPNIRPGDSIVVTVDDPVEGLQNDPYTGVGPAVYAYVSVSPPSQPGKSGPDIMAPESDILGSRFPVVDSLNHDGKIWYCFRMDSVRVGHVVVRDQYCFDLNDFVFTPGDTVEYVFCAMNAIGQRNYFTRAVGGQGRGMVTNDLWKSLASPMEFTVLPAGGWIRGGNILYVDDADDRGDPVQSVFDNAFDQLGIRDLVDRYDVLSPSSFAGNGLGGRVADPFTQIMACYRTIIYNSGNLTNGLIGDGTGQPEKSPDFDILLGFLSFHPDNPGLFLSGDNIAQEWVTLGGGGAINLRSSYLNFGLQDGDHIAAGSAPGTLLEGVGDCFNDIITGPDSLFAVGGCPILRDFDVLVPQGTAQAELVDPQTGNVFAVSQITENAALQNACVLMETFSLETIGDVAPNVPHARIEHLADVLNWLKNASGGPPTSVPPQVYENFLANNYPNPFNPVTTIRYGIKQPSAVTLRVYNVLGQVVRTLVDEKQTPRVGGYTVVWDGTNNKGQKVATGVYFYKLTSRDFVRTKKMVLLK